MEERLDEFFGQQGAAEQKFPSVAELEAQIETRTYRRGTGNLFVNGGRNVKKLEPMPKNATIQDFFRLRFAPANHVLQSATRALKTGMTEEAVLACLLHDVCGADQGRPRLVGRAAVRALRPGEDQLRDPLPPALRFYPKTPATSIPISIPHLRADDRPPAVHPRPTSCAQPQVVHGAAPRHGERPLRVRPERQGVA